MLELRAISKSFHDGESDLQVTTVDFADYTLLKEAEVRFPIEVDLWTRTQGSRVVLLPRVCSFSCSYGFSMP